MYDEWLIARDSLLICIDIKRESYAFGLIGRWRQMTTVQRLYPWSYANKGSDAMVISDSSIREALETMREPHFYTGYSGLLSELGSSSIIMRVQGVEMDDVASKLMITDLAKSMLFQLTAFGFAIVSIAKRRIEFRDEFVVTQIRNAEEFTIGFQTHDSRRVYFAKENSARNEDTNSPGALKRFVDNLVHDVTRQSSSAVSSDEQDSVGRDPNAVFLLVVSRPPSWNGCLMSSASVISPVRKDLENRMRVYQTQGYNHAYPLVYVTQQPTALPPVVKEAGGPDQQVQTSIYNIEQGEEIRATEEKITMKLNSENVMTIITPKMSSGDGEMSRFIRPLAVINSRFEIAQGPNPVAPVFPVDQTEWYVDQVSACLAVPRSYVRPNVSKVQTMDEQSIRETKLAAHFRAVSSGLEKALSYAQTLASTWDLETGRDAEPGVGEDESEVEEEPDAGAKSDLEPTKKKTAKTKFKEDDQRLLVEVKITLALPLERITYLMESGFLKRDKGLEMIAQMFGFAFTDLISEKEAEVKAEKEAKLAAEAKGRSGGSGNDKKSGSKRKLDEE